MTHEDPDVTRSPVTDSEDGSQTSANTTDEAQDQGWRSSAHSVDSTLRSGVDRVRPVVQRAVAAVLPLLRRIHDSAAMRRLRERVAPLAKQVSAKFPGASGAPTRVRAMQAGGVVAAVGVVGLVIAGLAGPGTQQRDVQEAAESGSMSPETAQRMLAETGDNQADSSTKSEAEKPAPLGPPVEGIDVSNHNGSDIDWNAVANDGKKFSFVLATDGSTFTSPTYDQQYHGAKDAGVIAGAYHFARPDSSGPEEQANRFLDVADYKPDGKTLPPVLDLETDPSGGGCYGKSPEEMQQWVDGFNKTVEDRTGEKPIIYANPSFWSECMGGTDKYADQDLWLAGYEVDEPELPQGFNDWDFWQYTSEGTVDGVGGQTDINVYNEGMQRLQQLAR